MRYFLLAIAVMLVYGCATGPFGSATSGGANYTYSKKQNPDGSSSCDVTVNSARDVQNGTIKVGKDCQLTAGADQTGGVGDAIQAVAGVISGITQKIPNPTPLPAENVAP